MNSAPAYTPDDSIKMTDNFEKSGELMIKIFIRISNSIFFLSGNGWYSNLMNCLGYRNCH